MTEHQAVWWEEKGCYGYKKPCPQWLKNLYFKAVNYECEECHRKEKLTPHRIIRGNEGGLYTIAKLHTKESNIKVLCNDCHKKYHSKEF